MKEKSKYRSRSGFSQSDGIAQFSANYNRRSKYKLAPRMDSINNGINDDNYRPPSYEPYRPQQPRSLFPYCSDDESYLNRQNSSLHSPQWVILLLPAECWPALGHCSHSSLIDYLAQVILGKKLSQHFLLHFPIGVGSYDHHAKYQGVFQDL